ncbi:MAG: glycosyltransferase family 2 protein [Candidatus Lernaella stagnicola]|nr:glycosyltransferase family 2 protein [Candidatus Lernaella stagnicola]
MAELAVQIVTYNSASDIEACLEALRDADLDMEIHVWDNASRDATVQTVRSHAEVSLHTSEINLGYCTANNRLLRKSTAEFVLFLNPDAQIGSRCLPRLLQTLRESPQNTAAVGPKMLKPGGRVIDSAGIDLTTSRLAPRDLGAGEIDRNQYDTPGPSAGSSFACALWRREAVEAVTLNDEFLDEDFFAYFEDVDVCRRAHRLGWSFLYEPRAVCEHRRGHPADHGPTLEARAFVNRLLVFLVNENIRNNWLYLLFALPLEFARLVWRSVQTPGFGVAWRMLVQSWPKARRKHRALSTAVSKI